MNMMLQVGKCQQPVKKHHHAIWKLEIVFGVVANVLELADNVVRAKSHGARGKRRHARTHGRPMPLQKLFCDLEDIPLPNLALLSFFNQDLLALRAQLHIRTRAQKSVPSNLLSALDGLQQKRMLLSARNREKSRDWREQIRHHGLHHWHQCGLAREAGEFLLGRAKYLSRGTGCTI